MSDPWQSVAPVRDDLYDPERPIDVCEEPRSGSGPNVSPLPYEEPAGPQLDERVQQNPIGPVGTSSATISATGDEPGVSTGHHGVRPGQGT